jgi:arylsulfatase A-like enzyme
LAATAIGGAPERAAGADGDGRPNVLHILTDDQTIDSLRHMGELQRTLIDRGTRFADYHTVQPLCCPSRATFLTGQYPHNHRILSNLEPFGYGAMDWTNTLYTAMSDAGYRTGWLGKVMNAKGDQGLRPEPGFDEWLVPIGAGESGSMFNYALSDNGRRRYFEDRFQNDVLAERAHEFIAAGRTEKPWFLTVSFHSPHWTRCPKTHERCAPQPAPEDAGTMGDIDFPFPPNYDPSPQYRFRTNRYWGHELEALQSVDRIVGSLVEQLNRQGELDDTVIVFQSDNGFLHGEHGVFDKDVPWDRSVRVPLIIRGPGFAEGDVRSDLTANVDVPATILDLAGAEPPRPLDGYSLLSAHHRKFLLLERLVTTNDRKRYPWLEVKTAKGLTYWRDLRGGHVHLYDLRSDQWQARNLAGRKPGLVRSLERRVRRARHCADPCP